MLITNGIQTKNMVRLSYFKGKNVKIYKSRIFLERRTDLKKKSDSSVWNLETHQKLWLFLKLNLTPPPPQYIILKLKSMEKYKIFTINYN